MRNLRQDALRIWQAGVEAVRSERLVKNVLHLKHAWLRIGDETMDLRAAGRIVVVGAGKAGAGMAAAVEQVLGDDGMQRHDLSGWMNVPADCVRPLKRIRLHAARPAGVNEPTEAGVVGSGEILRIVESLGERDLCLCLISGGGSALLPCPAPGVSFADKQQVTRFLSAAGANIRELNTVRKQLSQIKGGGLARACKSGRLVSLIISDVLGDPLDVIASGPTVPNESTAADALRVLEKFDTHDGQVPAGLIRFLEAKQDTQDLTSSAATCRVTNLVIGNNATAVAAAEAEAKRLGYVVESHAAVDLEGQAEDVGRDLARRAIRMCSAESPTCFISGGEPVVKLVAVDRRGLGGRNQQLALAALLELQSQELEGIALLSGGSDGEDGPTDAAGACIDQEVQSAARERGLDPQSFLERNDAYHFFEPLDALIKTGPTHTNVCDVRVVVTSADEEKPRRHKGTERTKQS